MPDYRRYFLPGGTYFFTLVTNRRRPLFWEHTIDDVEELHGYLDYIHYNPVKHGLVSCPHCWPLSSFRRWVERGLYDFTWGCSCNGPRHVDVGVKERQVGEP